MASCQEGKTAVIRLWEYSTGACLGVLNAHASGMACLDISPDGRALLAVGNDAQARARVCRVWVGCSPPPPHSSPPAPLSPPRPQPLHLQV